MHKAITLNETLLKALAELMDAEKQLIQLLPVLMELSYAQDLRLIIDEHDQAAKEQFRRLQDFVPCTQQGTCRTIIRLAKQTKKKLHKAQSGAVGDEIIIEGLLQMENYEIAQYLMARDQAQQLGQAKIVELLDESINEELTMHLQLNELTQGMINLHALVSGYKGGFYPVKNGFVRKQPRKKIKEDSRYIDEGNPNTEGL